MCEKIYIYIHMDHIARTQIQAAPPRLRGLLGLVRLHFFHLCGLLDRLRGLGGLGHEVSELRLQALHDLAGVHVLPGDLGRSGKIWKLR